MTELLSIQALAWLQESEASYLNKFKNLATNKDEMKRMYKEFCEFTDRLKVRRPKFKIDQLEQLDGCFNLVFVLSRITKAT